MLFDLQSTRRRRNTVRVIYGLLAILMIVGLVFLGVGTGTSGGPLNAGGNTGGGSSSAAANGAAKSEINSALRTLRKDPSSASAYANLEQAYLAAAQSSTNYNDTQGLYTKNGKAYLEKVISTWKQYQSTVKGTPNQNAVILAAYAMDSTADFSDATVVWQDFIAQVPQSTKGYECLAATAYATKNTTLGAQALKKAISLIPKLDRTEETTQLNELKTASEAKTYAAGACV